MKSLFLPGILLATITSSQGQGTVNFSSFATGVNAPVTNVGGARITSPVYLADLYFSANTDASTDQFTAAHFNVPFSTTTSGGGGGYFLGGARTVTNVPGGTVILAQVRVWDSSRASTYEQATNYPGLFGYSQPPILIQLGQPPAPAPALVGLQGFSLINGIEYAPTIDKQPRTQNAPIGATVYFGVHATNPPLVDIGGPFYQWYFSLTNPLPGATKPVLKLTNVQPAQAGSYHVVVGNLQGPKFSTVVNLGVINTALEAPLVPVLAISSGVGSHYVLQYAANLDPASSWLELASLTPTNTPQLYVDGSSTNVPARIYRLVQVP